MTTVSELLEERFHYAGVWYLERSGESGNELTEDEQRIVDHFMQTLVNSVPQVRESILATTKELSDKHPELFENVLVALIQHVGPNFLPANATEFVEHLNKFVQEQAPNPCVPQSRRC